VGERSLTPVSSVRRTATVQCNICGEVVDNSEDLAKHMEKMHAIEETDKPEQEETSPAEEDIPPPPIIPARM
jgi:uncharacterized Zn finger protein (UPF0148 family)